MPITSNEWLGDFTANTNTAEVQDQVRTFQLANGDFWVTWRDANDAGAGRRLRHRHSRPALRPVRQCDRRGRATEHRSSMA